MDRPQLRALLARYDEPAFRTRQLFHALHRRKVQSIEDIHEIPRSLRNRLAEQAGIHSLRLNRTFDSGDGTRRYLFTITGGEAIEAVWIPDAGRATICISSQAGCPLACEFCLTAQIGRQRNLTAAEIIGQVIEVLRNEQNNLLVEGTSGTSFPQVNLVLMGMGEPFLNYENVMQAIRVITDQEGMNLRPRHITISTAGIVPRIPDFGREPIRPELAVSLSAPNDDLRNRLMPINKRYPLSELMEACGEFPLAKGKYLTFEYVMLDGINDHNEHARQLLKLLASLRARNAAKVNLIPHNPAPGLSFRPSPPERIEAFQSILKSKFLPTFIRRPRGRDISAACGQLAAQGNASSQLEFER